jgi:hypothetical protein
MLKEILRATNDLANHTAALAGEREISTREDAG